MNAAIPASQLDWATLYQEYFNKIYNYIYRRTSDPVLTEDLTADVFVKAIDSSQRGKGHKKSFAGWLFRIAHNLIIDHYRQRDRWIDVSIDDMPQIVDPSSNPVRDAELSFDTEALQDGINRLTAVQAQVVTLRFIEGLTFDEIAALMDKQENSIKALQHRALISLFDRLNGVVAETDTRTPLRQARAEIVREILLQYGPMTIKELAVQLGCRKATASDALYQNSDIFTKVGTRYYGKVLLYVYGLVGIHDRETVSQDE